MLADRADHVVGVDTHRDAHSAAILTSSTGVVEAQTTLPADGGGYEQLLGFGRRYAPGRRAWAIEGTGSYGAGLAGYLAERGEWVVEVDRPRRQERRSAAKSDELDAIRAALHVLGRKHLAQPRSRGEREAMRVLLTARAGAVASRTRAIGVLKGLIISAPRALRDRVRRLSTDEQLAKCAGLRTAPAQSTEHRATIIALRSTARRALALEAEASDLQTQLELLVAENAPWLLAEPGVGPITAAQLLVSWSHPGRFRSEAAFASLSGAAPIPASSGQTVRHRLNPGGDRHLNRALHTITVCRMRDDARTRAYVTRRRAQGMSTREIRRCLKRYTARHLYRLLEQQATAPTNPRK
jgi:transposase